MYINKKIIIINLYLYIVMYFILFNDYLYFLRFYLYVNFILIKYIYIYTVYNIKNNFSLI